MTAIDTVKMKRGTNNHATMQGSKTLRQQSCARGGLQLGRGSPSRGTTMRKASRSSTGQDLHSVLLLITGTERRAEATRNPDVGADLLQEEVL